MTSKIRPKAEKKISEVGPTDLVSLTIRLSSPLTKDEINSLSADGGELMYDNGTMAVIKIKPVNLGEFLKIESVVEVVK